MEGPKNMYIYACAYVHMYTCTHVCAGRLPGSAGRLPGSTGSLPGSAGRLPGSAGRLPGSAYNLTSRQGSRPPKATSLSNRKPLPTNTDRELLEPR